MKVRLMDIDSRIPNLALMRLSSWHKARGDTVSLNDGPRPDLVYASSVFTWGRQLVERLRPVFPEMVVGGAGYDLHTKLPEHVASVSPDYGLYDWETLALRGFKKKFGMGYLIQGCPRRCEFCIVPKMYPKAEQVATIDDLLHPESNYPVLLDDNFLAKQDRAIDLLDEMRERQVEVCFSQGLDIRFVTEALAEGLATTKFWSLHHTSRVVTFAFDSVSIEKHRRKGVEMLNRAGVRGSQLQSFFIVGFDSTFEEDMHRFNVIREYGADPYCMVFRDRDSGKAAVDLRLRHFARWVNRRLYKVCAFEEYARWTRVRGTYEMQQAMAL